MTCFVIVPPHLYKCGGSGVSTSLCDVKRTMPDKAGIWYNARQMEKTLENGRPDMEKKLKKRLLVLTWGELRDWSDVRSVERGSSSRITDW